MTNQIAQSLTNLLQAQYKSKYPQVFSNFESLKSGNADPMSILEQITGKFSPGQMQGFMQAAKSFGVPDEVLSQLQNGIKR